MDIEKKIEKLINRFYKKWYSGDDDVAKNFCVEDAPNKKEEQIKRLKELLELGYDVRTGYVCTSIRGYHRKVIFYKKLRP